MVMDKDKVWVVTRNEMATRGTGGLKPLSYQIQYIKRLGNYVVDLKALPQPIDEDLPRPSTVGMPQTSY